MAKDELTDEQKLALSPKVQLIEAGPGSGKTRTVVERMRTLAHESKRGHALISFTNTAANEAMRRISASGTSLPPSFIGTFDSFLHRYIVTPWHIRRLRAAPNYVHSWDDLGVGLDVVRHDEVAGEGLRLSRFQQLPSGSFTYPDESSGSDRRYVHQLSQKGYMPTDLVPLATRRIESLLKQGIYDSDNARIKALRILQSKHEEWLRKRLPLRFQEIIVDEFQDCSDIEIQLIKEFKALRINVVVVADPDQSIYEFRQASPMGYQQFRGALPPESIVTLPTNHRSSSAICELVSSLRIIGGSPIISARDGNKTEIQVLVGSKVFQRDSFVQILELENIPVNKSIVLSHRRNEAAALAGTSIVGSSSNRKTYQLLRSAAILRTSQSAQARKNEIQKLNNILLGLFKWETTEKNLRSDRKRELLELTDSQIASFALSLRENSKQWTDREVARDKILSLVGDHFGNMSRPLKSLKASLQAVPGDDWEKWEKSLEKTSGAKLPSSHIHRVKGQEYEAVLLGVGSRTAGQTFLLDDWQSGESTEALRVFYVGASRAKKILAIGCSKNNEKQLRQIFAKHAIEANWIVE